MLPENIFWLLMIYCSHGIVENLMAFAQGGSLNQAHLWKALNDNPQWVEVTTMLLAFYRSGELDTEKLRQLLQGNLPPDWITAMWKWCSHIKEDVDHESGMCMSAEGLEDVYNRILSCDICDFCSMDPEKHAVDGGRWGYYYRTDCFECPFHSLGTVYRKWAAMLDKALPTPIPRSLPTSEHSSVGADPAPNTSTYPSYAPSAAPGASTYPRYAPGAAPDASTYPSHAPDAAASLRPIPRFPFYSGECAPWNPLTN